MVVQIMELEEELRVVGNNLKSLEVSEEKANQVWDHLNGLGMRSHDVGWGPFF